MKRKIGKFIASVLICLGTGAVAGFFTASSVSDWYAGLEKPFFNPPNWIFGPVWNVLYFLMGVSLYLIWEKGKESIIQGKAIGVFFIQLFLNFLWSFVFFGLKSPELAFYEIVALWISIVATISFFFKVNRWASILLWPYILWVTFAAFLNYNIWKLNL